MGGARSPEKLPLTNGGGCFCSAGGKEASRAGIGLKMKKPQRGNAEASDVTTLQECTRWILTQ